MSERVDEKAGRPIVPYIKRDDISWWAGCRYVDQGPFETYIRETPCMTQWGATWAAVRLAKKARRLRDRQLAGYRRDVGDARNE